MTRTFVQGFVLAMLGAMLLASSAAAAPTYVQDYSFDPTPPGHTFSNPQGVAVTSDGTVYTAGDSGQGTPAVTRAYGAWWKLSETPSFKGSLAVPGGGSQDFAGIALDASGNVYVTDRSARRVEKYGPGGDFITSFGGSLLMTDPGDLAVSAGHLYVLDTAQNLVKRFSLTGTFEGSFGAGLTSGSFPQVAGIGAGRNTDTLYVADTYGGRLLAFGPGGENRGQITGLSLPTDAVVEDDGTLAVATTGTGKVTEMTTGGSVIGSFGSFGDLRRLAADGSDRIWTFDINTDLIQAWHENHAPGTPGAPAATPALSKDGNVALSWSAASDPDAGDTVEYSVEHRKAGDADWSAVASGISAGSHSLTETADGTWSYRVRANDQNGATSGFSSASDAVTVDIQKPPPAPDAPTSDADAPRDRDGKYTVSWNAVTDPNAWDSVTYTLQRKQQGDADWSTVETDLTGTSRGIEHGDGVWIYRVIAIDTTGAEAASADGAPITVDLNDAPTAPGTPEATPALSRTGAIDLHWDASTDADGDDVAYRLERRRSGGTWDAVTPAPASNSYSFSGLDEGTWEFRVTATDPLGLSSPASAAGSAKVDKTAPAAPSLSIAAGQTAHDGWYRDQVSIDVAAGGDPDLDDGSAGSGVDPLATPVVVGDNGTTTVTRENSDRAGNGPVGSSITVKVDVEAPTVTIAGCPAAPIPIGDPKTITVVASDGESGLVTNPSGPVQLDTQHVGFHTESYTVVDKVGHSSAEATCTYQVVWPFAGFYAPVNNRPTVNLAKAGSTIPVKFSLGGDRGLGIFADGYPKSVLVNPDGSASVDAIEETVEVAGPALSYDAGSQRYQFNWKTSKDWAGENRQLVLKLGDGTYRRIDVRFR